MANNDYDKELLEESDFFENEHEVYKHLINTYSESLSVYEEDILSELTESYNKLSNIKNMPDAEVITMAINDLRKKGELSYSDLYQIINKLNSFFYRALDSKDQDVFNALELEDTDFCSGTMRNFEEMTCEKHKDLIVEFNKILCELISYIILLHLRLKVDKTVRGKINGAASGENLPKKQAQQEAINIWNEKGEMTTRKEIIKGIRNKYNISQDDDALNKWLSEVDPVTLRGGRRPRKSKK